MSWKYMYDSYSMSHKLWMGMIDYLSTGVSFGYEDVVEIGNKILVPRPEQIYLLNFLDEC